MRDRLLPSLLFALAVVFTAVLVHIGSVLVLPYVAPRDAFTRLARPRALASLDVLAPAADDTVTPFRDPAAASALCRYDLDRGPLRVTTRVDASAAFVAVSFHGRYGVPFYALTDRAGNLGQIDVLLVSASQLERLEANDPDGEPVRDIRVTSPTREGFVQFDVLPRVGGLRAAERALRSMSCAVERNG